MFNEIVIHYFHPALNLALEDVRNVWLMTDKPVKLVATMHRGSLVFRIPGSGKRISYQLIKKGLIRKDIIIMQPLDMLPF